MLVLFCFQGNEQDSPDPFYICTLQVCVNSMEPVGSLLIFKSDQFVLYLQRSRTSYFLTYYILFTVPI